MIERLIIRRFAGLEEIDLELGRVNIFIGPQASGKSVCAKCLYWFKAFVPELVSAARRGQEKKQFENAYLNVFKEYFPGIWRSDEQLFLRYEIDTQFIQLVNKAGKLELTYDAAFVKTAESIRQQFREAEAKQGESASPSALFLFSLSLPQTLTQLGQHHAYLVDTRQLFILASRSFFAALKGSVLTFLANAPVTDPLLKAFLGAYELGRRSPPDADHPKTQPLWQLAQHILKGQLVVEGDEDFIVSGDGRRVRLANASSGQQEAFALLLLLINLASDEFLVAGISSYTVYAEEPEAHLFPESQRAMAQLMASVYHESQYAIQYVITTHSPYLLASFNNLVYARQLADALREQPAQLEALYRVVPQNQQLALADVRAYGFENGRAQLLIDEESGLLTADLIDSASDTTADQFAELMALDPAIHPAA